MEEKIEIVAETVIAPLPTTERGEGLHLSATLKKEPRLLYCSNELVIQRNLENINQVRINSEHAVKARVAKFSPNGEWICSGDESGQVFVWAHKSFVVKNTISVGKCCLDVAWSADGQRIVAVGRGKDEKGKVFPWNTNNKLGQLGAAQKGFLCCDFKPNRPFRVIGGSEDHNVYYYKGPPFKFEASCNDHANVVRGIAFSPDGSKYISCSSDKKILAFDGKTGKLIKVISDGKGKNDHHKGSIYELSWNSDGTKFVTSSADKTCKIWEYETGSVLFTYKFADKPTLDDMQVSCLWLDSYIISISLSGKINYLDPEFKNETPIKVITGHRKNINDVCFDSKNNNIYTCDSDCRVVKTECKSAECSDINGDPHKCAMITSIAINCDSTAFYTVGNNDTLCKTLICKDDEKEEKGGNNMGEKTIKLNGAARAVLTGYQNPNLVVIPTHKKQIHIINDLNIDKVIDIKCTPTTAALSTDDKLLAVGSGRDGENCIFFYDITTQKEVFVIKNAQYIRSEIVALAITPNGEYLASAHKDRAIWIWDLKNKDFEKPVNFNKGMKYHNGQISSIQFDEESKRLLTCANDSNIYLWLDPTNGKNTNIHLDHAFSGSIRKCLFIGKNKIVAIGGDSSIRFFNIQDKK